MVDHPAVERIDYPGLAEHPQHALAGKLFDERSGRRSGTARSSRSRRSGGREAGFAARRRARVALVATSLGGTHTVVSHVASTTHRQFDDAALEAAGISPGAVRFSIGLEDADDLIADIAPRARRAGRLTGEADRRPIWH